MRSMVLLFAVVIQLKDASVGAVPDCRLSEVPVVERSTLTIEETDDLITVKYSCDPGYWPKLLPDSVWCDKQVGSWSQLPDLSAVSDGDAGCLEDPDMDSNYYSATTPRAWNNCVDNPCLNNGVCAYNIAAASYICGCPVGYYGTHCEHIECPTSELPMVLHSTLQFPDEGQPLTTYTCNQGYQFPDGSTVQTTECDGLTGVWAALDYDACEPQQGLASVVGDPHHYTFDNARIDFQGVCTYILSQYHGIEADQFQIDARYERVGNKGDVAKLALISIAYHGDNIILGKRKKVLVNGKPVKAGYSPDYNSYRITREGDFMVFRSLSKITAAYNGRWKSWFDVPDLYRTLVEGLLGNYDGVKTNDFITRDGRKVLDNIKGHCAIGNSWQLEPVEMCPYDC